jgi:hypothetical protein
MNSNFDKDNPCLELNPDKQFLKEWDRSFVKNNRRQCVLRTQNKPFVLFRKGKHRLVATNQGNNNYWIKAEELDKDHMGKAGWYEVPEGPVISEFVDKIANLVELKKIDKKLLISDK